MKKFKGVSYSYQPPEVPKKPSDKEVENFINEVLYYMKNGGGYWFLPRKEITKFGEYDLNGMKIDFKPILKRFRIMAFRGGINMMWWLDLESLEKLYANECSEKDIKIVGEVKFVNGEWLTECEAKIKTEGTDYV